MSTLRFLASLALLALVAAPAPLWALPASQAASFEQALERAKVLERRNPLRYHIEAWEGLAGTQDARAIAELGSRYAKPARPRDQVQYLIASAAGTKGGAEATLDAMESWRAKARSAGDAWLWFQLLRARSKLRGTDDLVRIAREEKVAALRAAAIEALAAEKQSVLYQLIPDLATALPKKPEEQCILVGALATGLLSLADARSKSSNDWQRAALALVALLDQAEVPRPAKLVVARHLAKALAAERVVLESAAWRALLAGTKQEGREKAGGPTYVRPRFFGVEASGERICYVIDLSDSMCVPVPPGLREKHGGAPKSGPVEPGTEKKVEDELPWQVIKTRFDLAREHLRLSLGRLSEEQQFSIVVFGDGAKLLDGTSGMVKASKANVRKAMKTLDEYVVGATRPDRPYGTLLGNTNLHGAMKAAFRIGKKGLVDEYEYVEGPNFLEGCDTIFLLSDGDPTCDDYTVQDVDYGDGWVGDPESKEPHARTQNLNYMGPYSNWPRLLEDVERLNMFREVEIHCISIGDGNEGGLKRLTEIGLGTFKKFDS